MVFEWAYSGVNKTVPRNAGPDCAEFLDPVSRKIETVIVIVCALCMTIWGYKNMSLKSRYDSDEDVICDGSTINTSQQQLLNSNKDPGGGGVTSDATSGNVAATERQRRRHYHRYSRSYYYNNMSTKKALLMLMSLIWGMEIGYKFSSRTVIYLLNPCHITTAIQIYLLAAAPSDLVTAVFRIHLNFLNGPLLAFLFPETDTRILPLEAAIYWIQHGMMVVVPYYLIRLGGVYHMEKITDFSWNAFSYGINALYHICILQAIAIPTQVNLNHMLCPAILDPFSGPHYRKIGFLHQAILCPLLCKLFCVVAYKLNKNSHLKHRQMSYSYNSEQKRVSMMSISSTEESLNGHSHVE